MFSRFQILRALLLSLVTVVASIPGRVGAIELPTERAPYADQLDQYLQASVEHLEIPGLAVAVTQNGQIVYVAAIGVRNVDTQQPLTPFDLFHWASVSKVFVATAILQLVQDDKIDLDGPVVDYLPYFELDDARSSQITIRQMLNHSSGMPDVEDYEWDKPQLHAGAAEEYVRSLNTQSMVSEPGERYRYSNMAYDTLGEVIAKVSEMSFEDYMRQNILDPLGMQKTTFFFPEADPELQTYPHLWEAGVILSPVYPYNRRHAPSSTLNSSVVEMTQWALANLNRGELNGHRILPENAYELLWTPTMKVSDRAEVGLGWFISEYEGSRTLSHGGRDVGYTSNLALLPDDDTAVMLASNFYWTPMGSLRNGVIDVVMGRTPTLPKRSIAFPFSKAYEEGGIAAAKALYQELEESNPERYRFGASELNELGYSYLDDNRAGDAIQVFLFNTELYPDEANGWDSLGEAYLTSGETDRAIDAYKQALRIDPDLGTAQAALQKLGAN